jgi:hypothetical protein
LKKNFFKFLKIIKIFKYLKMNKPINRMTNRELFLYKVNKEKLRMKGKNNRSIQPIQFTQPVITPTIPTIPTIPINNENSEGKKKEVSLPPVIGTKSDFIFKCYFN